MAPYRHLVVDVTFTSARTNTNTPHIGARLPLPGSLTLGAQHNKLDADLRTLALLGTPAVQSVHDFYPFALKDGGGLAHVAVELHGVLEMSKTRVLYTRQMRTRAWDTLVLRAPPIRAHVRYLKPPKALLSRLLEYDLSRRSIRYQAVRSSFEYLFEKWMLLHVMMAHHAANSYYFKIGRRNARRGRLVTTRR
jgi:hypothetical protein